MSVIGTMTVGIDAVATKTKPVFQKVMSDGKKLADEIKKIGNIEVGSGDAKTLLGNSISWVRGQFMQMIDDIEKLKGEAQKAGQSIEEFTSGAFTAEDVRKAQEFSNAMEKLRDVIGPELRKEILIDIAPAASASIEVLSELIKAAAELAKETTEGAAGVGEQMGNRIAPVLTGNAAIDRRNAADAARVRRRNPLTSFLIDRDDGRRRDYPTAEERQAIHQRAEQREYLERIAKNTEKTGESGQTVVLEPASNAGGI